MADQIQQSCATSSKNNESRLIKHPRMKKMREKRAISDPGFKQTESKRIEMHRKRKVEEMSDYERTEYRKKQRDRQRLSRLKKQKEKVPDSQNTPKKSSFKSPQSLGKAIRRTEKALPSSPSKRQIVVCGVARRIGLNLIKKAEDALRKSGKALSLEVKQCVNEFYTRMDIVYTAPGFKQTMNVWENGSKKVVPKMYLTMYLKEVFERFKQIHPEVY